MNSVFQEIHVAFRFPVHFTSGVFDLSNPLLRDTIATKGAAIGGSPVRVVFVIDRGVLRGQRNLISAIKQYCAEFSGVLTLAKSPVVLPGGEKVKNLPRYVKEILRVINDGGLCRHSYVVAIGGGALLDVVGYAAATAHRGIRLIRIPTTVLSQDDSGVGVKNGINAFGLKNLLGTFAPPFAVINDSAFLDLLPAREKRGGMAEAVKVALIRDADFLLWIEREADALARFAPNALDTLVRRCAKLHMHQIAHGGDPFETGSARPLDYGHWSAHKLEGLTRHALRHGEAVAIGIALDARYSVLSGLLPEGEDERVLRLLARLGFTLWDDALELRDGKNRRRVIAGLADFQEHLGGELTITLLERIGRGVEVHVMDHALIEQSIRWLKARWKTLARSARNERKESG
jgi:3-dehydroquinate synthase